MYQPVHVPNNIVQDNMLLMHIIDVICTMIGKCNVDYDMMACQNHPKYYHKILLGMSTNHILFIVDENY